jgi:hypothetical protein
MKNLQNKMTEAPMGEQMSSAGVHRQYLTADEVMLQLEPRIRSMFR